MSCNTANDDHDNRDPGSSAPGLSAVDGDATSLFEYIVRDKVWGANLDPPESAKNVIKPWHQRLSADPCTQSNVDDQLAITVPFTCPVRLKSILINTGTGDFAPTRCRAFVNRPDGIDFDEVEHATADDHPANLSPLANPATLGGVESGRAQADFALLRGQEGVVEYPVSVARFSHTNSITILLSHSNATTLSRFFYLGFRGTALVLKSEPGERLNIGAANSADRPVDRLREKRGASQGLAGGSGRGTPTRSQRYVVSDHEAAQRIARLPEGGETTPRRSPRRNRTSTPSAAQQTESPTTTPTRKRKAQPSQHDGGNDETESTPRATQSPTKTPTPANPITSSRTPRTAPQARPRPSLADPSASTSDPQSSRGASSAATSSTAAVTSASDPTRRRSLSQPPPNDVLMRQLQASSMTPSAKYASAQRQTRTPSQAAATTPGRRILGTPRRTATFTAASSSSSHPQQQQGMQTPATDKRRKRNDTLLASARRSASRKSLLWGGIGGWAGGREESPMDLLRRLARAPGFIAPPTLAQDSISMPPPASRPGASARASAASSAADASNSRNRGTRESGASTTRATMLVPGESVPGDLTRDSNISNSQDVDESMLSHTGDGADDRSRSRISDIGIPRQASGVGLVRGGIFAAMADRPKTSRISTGSRVSFADQSFPESMRVDEMSRREEDLQRSLGQQSGFVSASGIDLATAKAIRRLDDLTRQSFFSHDGGLQFDDDSEEEGEGSGVGEKTGRGVGRSISEPLEGDNSIVMHDFPQVHSEQEEEVSDSLPLDHSRSSPSLSGEPGEEEEGRRQALDTSRDISDLVNTSIPSVQVGDESRISRVSFAAQDESFQPDDAYSSDAEQYALDSADEDSDLENVDSTADRLDLLDPKDLTSLLKRRIVKKRKSRISPITGNPLPALPASVMRDIFSSFLTPSSSTPSLLSSNGGGGSKKAKLDSSVVDELDSAVHDFFVDFSTSLLAQSRTRSTKRSGEGGTITEADVVAVLKRQGRVTQRMDASSLAHKMLPRELTDQMELGRWAKSGAVQTTLGFGTGGGGRGGRGKGDKSVAEIGQSSESASGSFSSST